MKYCTKCKEEKPATLEFFKPEKRTPDGLNWYCRMCVSVDRKKYKTGAAGRAAVKRWNASDAHKEQLRKCKADPDRAARDREHDIQYKRETSPALSAWQKQRGLRVAQVFEMLATDAERERFAVDLFTRNAWPSDDAKGLEYYKCEDHVFRYDAAIMAASRLVAR
jgi:hypothetical protein